MVDYMLNATRIYYFYVYTYVQIYALFAQNSIPYSITSFIVLLWLDYIVVLYSFCSIYWHLSYFVLYITNTFPTKKDTAYLLAGEYSADFIGPRIAVL